MEQNQQAFIAGLEQLKETARLQGNMLTGEQIDEEFGKWKLNEEQLTLIYDYLNKNNIGIDEPGNVDENLSGEDVNFLEMYLNELKELPNVTDGEKRAVMMSALAEDKDAQAKLVEIYLPQALTSSQHAFHRPSRLTVP